MSRWPAEPPWPPPPALSSILFIDRDGVLVVEKDYLSDPAAVELVPGAAAALGRARAAGYRLIGISNQSGLGRGLFAISDFEAVMTRLDELLRSEGCPLDDFYYCPHAPAAQCDCRKPRLGLLREAAASWAWDPDRSWVIGDKVSDLEFAHRARLRSILVRTGHGHEQQKLLDQKLAVLVADDLPAAVALILAEASR